MYGLNVYAKPGGCGTCEYASTGNGFCPDWVPVGARVAFLGEAPAETEILEHEPFTGGTGKILTKAIERLGYRRSDASFHNCLRCRVPNSTKYPMGRMARVAERACRQYDSVGGQTKLPPGLLDFRPDMFIVCIHPAACLRSWNLLRPIQEVIGKGFRFAEAGKRPLVLLGDHAKELVLRGRLEGGVTRWHGHWGPLGSDWYDNVLKGLG